MSTCIARVHFGNQNVDFSSTKKINWETMTEYTQGTKWIKKAGC